MINRGESGMKPFLFRFKEGMSSPPDLDVRYDPQRQLTQIRIEDRWQDMADHEGRGPWQDTTITRIARETTDDR